MDGRVRPSVSAYGRTKAEGELKKLRNMSPMSAESTVVRNYLDWLLSIPWGKAKTKAVDLDRAEKILDEDHYGLEKVKDRIVEYLAVQQRVDKVKAPILCFVGPPGVGVPGVVGVPVVGVLPLHSSRHAEFLHNEVPGITVPDAVRARMREAGDRGLRAGRSRAQHRATHSESLFSGPTEAPHPPWSPKHATPWAG